MRYNMKFIPLLLSLVFPACAPVAGPDKSVAGAILGAGWGAGAGAVVGNQINSTGPGALVGAGLGAGQGLLTGIGFDVAEGGQLQTARDIEALEIEVSQNERRLKRIQDRLDNEGKKRELFPLNYTIFFDSSRASLRMGSALELERLANSIKLDHRVKEIQLNGHSDDLGNKEENRRLSELRAKTIKTFLLAHGVSSDIVKVVPYGAEQPIASNTNKVGQMLNRRVEIVLLK
jgi:outer membrane protein OmpA-like peptidoglycan-associated protein